MAIRYEPKVYRAQGSTKYVVASGGEIEVESGGYMSVESGGIVNYESGAVGQIGGVAALPTTAGYVYAVSGFQEYFERATSAGIANYGISYISSAIDLGTSNLDYNIGQPITGVKKTIIKAITAGPCMVSLSTVGAASFDSSGIVPNYFIKFSTAPVVIEMMGSSADAKYSILSIRTGSSIQSSSDALFAATT